MKRLFWLLYLLLTLGQVAMDKERPEVFLSELNHFMRNESPLKAQEPPEVVCPASKVCKSM